MALTEKYVSALAGGSGNGLTEGTAFTWAQMVGNINGGSGVGCRYNIKADGTYSISADVNISSGSGSNASPIAFRGYKTTVGDGYLGRDAIGALLTANMPLLSLSNANIQWPDKCSLECLNIQGTRDDFLIKMNTRSLIVACYVSNGATGNWVTAVLFRESCLSFECDFILTNSGQTRYCIEIQEPAVRFDSCRIISSSPYIGAKVDQTSGFFGCLIKGPGTGSGLLLDTNSKAATIRNCTITGWTDGILFSSSTGDIPSLLCGNMLTDNSGYGINFTTANFVALIGPNRTRDNALGDTNNFAGNWLQCGRIFPLVTTDTGGPETDYVNAAANNYNLIPASPGKGANRPSVSDLGPYGLPDPAGGGGAAVFNPLAQTIIRSA